MPLLSKQIERRIEDELRNYQENLKQYAERREDVLHGSSRPYSSEGRAVGHVSDTTLARVQKLALVDQDAKWVLVIRRALKGMDRELQLLVQYMYWDQMRYIKIADKLHISTSLVYAWKDRVILTVGIWATQEGLIKPMEER